MSYSVQKFIEHNLELFNQLKNVEEEKKKLEEISKNAKKQLLDAMLEHGIKSIDNDLVKVTVTKVSESTSIAELLEDYPKVTKRAESLRVVFK